MKIFNLNTQTLRKAALGSALSLLVAMHSAPTLAAGDIEFINKAEVEIKTVGKDGKVDIKRIPAKSAPPGAEIIYTSTFKNIGAKPAGNIVITNPVPNDSVYKADTAVGENTDITFSVNGGKNYGAPASLTVTEKDGKTRPAIASDYTHIRWAYKGELAVGKTSSVGFKSQIK